VAAGAELADELAVAEEQRQLVSVDGELGLHRDGLVGVLVDDVVLELVRPRDGELFDPSLDETHDAHASSLE
jgi:hypothetical protein